VRFESRKRKRKIRKQKKKEKEKKKGQKKKKTVFVLNQVGQKQEIVHLRRT